MARWVKIYLIVSTVALLGFAAFYVFTFLLGRSQHNVAPELIGNIAVSGRFVTSRQMDDLIQDQSAADPTRTTKSGLYLVTSAWLKTLPSRRVVSAQAEITSPEFLKGRRISIGGGFLGEAEYKVQPIPLVNLSEEQMKFALSTKPELRIVDVWVK